MKRIILLLAICVLVSGFVFAQDKNITYMDPFVPRSPEVMGQGGSFTAIAEGYNSLFTNPAGFASDKGQLTIVSLNPWVYVRPDRVATLVETLTSSEGEPDMGSVIGIVSDQITGGGFGIGFSTGLAWTGKGLGLGVVAEVDSYIYGKELFGAAGEATATVGLIGGLAIPFNIFGMKLTVGGDVRPMYRAYIPMSNDVVMGLLASIDGDPLEYLLMQNAYAGVGLGIDLGAMLDIGPFTVGMSIRDLFGTRFSFTSSTMDDIATALQEGGDLSGAPISENDVYMIPMEINVGAAFHPDLGGFSFIIDPKVHVDLKDPIGVIRDGQSPWTLLHIGAEAKMFRFLSLRGGFYQGYITGGVGMKLLFLDINASFFTLERGRYVTDRPNSGLTLEAALRF